MDQAVKMRSEVVPDSQAEQPQVSFFKATRDETRPPSRRARSFQTRKKKCSQPRGSRFVPASLSGRSFYVAIRLRLPQMRSNPRCAKANSRRVSPTRAAEVARAHSRARARPKQFNPESDEQAQTRTQIVVALMHDHEEMDVDEETEDEEPLATETQAEGRNTRLRRTKKRLASAARAQKRYGRRGRSRGRCSGRRPRPRPRHAFEIASARIRSTLRRTATCLNRASKETTEAGQGA